MTAGIFRVSIPESLDMAFTFIKNCLNSSGLMIQNSETGIITSWSEEGEQIVTASEDLLHKIKSGYLKNVQFWISSSDDIFVSWSENDRGLSVFSIYLDGVDIGCSLDVASKIMEGLLTQYTNMNLSGCVFSMAFE
ncbi:hypothetical protein AB4851_14910 [Burkholderia sp. 22PA0099]|uniref:hypothetical protein n=1 Tax=Burkholderia sp. 22PA0099 TaxID=3237372 RepID=UPI0039C1E8EC